MKVGTDVSLEVCRSEGYLVAEYNSRLLFKNGKMNRDYPVDLTRSEPSKWYDNARVKFGASYPIYRLDESLSYNDILESYLSDRERIDQFMGNYPNEYNDFTYVDYTAIEPTIYDLLNLADCVDSYKGLSN